jgi:LPXTG-motif cell wall-anchored protein
MRNTTPPPTFIYKLLATVSIGGILASPLSILPSTVEATSPAVYNGKIVFESERDGNGELYVMNADGGNQMRLTDNGDWDSNPTWSPDGTKILFTSGRSGITAIYTMDADGSDQRQLTNLPGNYEDYKWSPDGSRILFVSNRDGDFDVYAMNADGSNQTRLTNAAGWDRKAAWSPDGSKIAFSSERDDNGELYIMNADGSNQARLTNAAGWDTEPVWSPEGSVISFISNRHSNQWEVYKINIDGSGELRLTDNPGRDDDMQWSPDGTKLSYLSMDSTQSLLSLIIMNADGSDKHIIDLTALGMVWADEAHWSPDGKQHLVTAYYNDWDNYGLFTVDSSGDNLTLLTPDGASGYANWHAASNMVPSITNDSLGVRYNTATILDVLANDTDEEPLSAANLTIKTPPQNGTAALADGKIKYTPNAGFSGKDELTYQICDSFLQDQKCAIGIVAITVAGPGAPIVTLNKINNFIFDAHANELSTTTSRPTFTGTASPEAIISIEIHSEPIILTTQATANGLWSLTADQDIPAGTHTVYISATKDGVTTQLDSFVLAITASQPIEIPNTGAPTFPVRLVGACLLIAGLALALIKKRRASDAPSIPSLFI